MSQSHAGHGNPVVGREDERASILDFVESCERLIKGRTMYVCGSPGVGKTLSVQHVLNAWAGSGGRGKKEPFRRTAYLNAIGLQDHFKVFSFIEDLVKGTSYVSRIKRKVVKEDAGETFAQLSDCVDSIVAASKSHCREPVTVVAVVDEIDYLCPSLASATRGGSSKTSVAAKRQFDLISALFTLPKKLEGTKCTLVIIGIANSIDLSTKLTALATSSRATRGRDPLIDSTVIFRPYTESELQSILDKVSGGSLDKEAVRFCTQRIAKLNGDCRTVMDLCKQATSNSASSTVSVRDVAATFNRVFRSQSQSVATLKALPQQQLLVLVAACRHASKHQERSEYPITDLRTALNSLINDLNIPAGVLGQMTSVLEHAVALSNTGLMGVKQPSGIKNRVAMWRVSGPPDLLEQALTLTSELIAHALGHEFVEKVDEPMEKRRKTVGMRE